MRRSHLRALLLLLCLPGCHSWQRRDLAAFQPAPARAISGSHPVRVTHAGGSQTVLHRPQVEGDSIVGEAGTRPRRAAVAVADVRYLEERRVSGPRTAVLVAGIAVGAFALLIAALAATPALGY